MSLQNLYIHRSRYAPTILQVGTGTYSFEGIPAPHPAPPHSNHSKAFVPPTVAMESRCQPEAVQGWTCGRSPFVERELQFTIHWVLKSCFLKFIMQCLHFLNLQ